MNVANESFQKTLGRQNNFIKSEEKLKNILVEDSSELFDKDTALLLLNSPANK